MSDNKEDNDECLATRRTRRTKKDKGGRLDALQRLKDSKNSGKRLEYEVNEVENVYDEVDENEYSDIVLSRQEEDWIVDDRGCGYVEDGREIFDDEMNDIKDEKQERKRKSRNANIRETGSKAKNIKSMFAASAMSGKTKKSSEDKSISNKGDDILGNLMTELRNVNPKADGSAKKTTKKKTPLVNPFKQQTKRRSTSQDFGEEPASFETTPPSSNRRSARKTPLEHPAKLARLNFSDEDEPVQVKQEISIPKRSFFEEQKKLKKDKEREVRIKREAEIEREMNNDDYDDSALVEMDEDCANGDGGGDCRPIKREIDDVMDESREPLLPEVKVKRPAMNRRIKDEPRDEAIGNHLLEDSGWTSVRLNESSSISTSSSTSTPCVDSTLATEDKKDMLTFNLDPELPDATQPSLLRMYWLDAYEDHYRQPGVVYLFGKVWLEKPQTFVSCCVAVKNINRKVYLLPRDKFKMGKVETDEDVNFIDVYNEFNDSVADNYKIMKFKSRKIEKKYAFEIKDVPSWAEYMEITYSAEYPALPINIEGNTFSRAFGTNRTSMEALIIDRALKGPSWISIKSPEIINAPKSWCKIELSVDCPESITPISDSSPLHAPPPPLTVVAISTMTLQPSEDHQNEIIAVTGLIHKDFRLDKPAPKSIFQQHFCIITKPSSRIFPVDFQSQTKKHDSVNFETVSNERTLLNLFLARIHKIDPDLIVGHDLISYDLEVIMLRLWRYKITQWSRLGRLRRTIVPKLNTSGKGRILQSVLAGRLLVDVKVCAMELIRCRSYDLTQLTDTVLKAKRAVVEKEDIIASYLNSKDLIKTCELLLMDTTYIIRIMFELNVLPLALQITNICGNIMSKTLMGGRAERNEYLLLHAFSASQYIIPDKTYSNKSSAENSDESVNKKKASYEGGLVLEPKRGFYDKCILMLDFNSLYPSIIQEYNICFTTVNQNPVKSEPVEGEETVKEVIVDLPESGLPPGILPTEIRKLVQSRRAVKNSMKETEVNSDLYVQYDIRQKALKLTANSMYGCLGFSMSRFYAKPLAALVTSKGREILLHTKEMVEKMNLEVIYGDTDSIMINTNSTDMEQVYKLGNKVKIEVNKLYKLLQIEIDGVYKSMLLLKKKKYAALAIDRAADGQLTTHQELKGLDIVRRDWCQLAKDAGNFVVSEILSGEERDIILENIHDRLIDVGKQVREGNLPVEIYTVTKSLSKNPEDYPDRKGQAHVNVALRLNESGGKQIKGGDTVTYVICDNNTNDPTMQRAYHPDELAKDDSLKIDIHYYLANQIHPVVSRLCDVIDGTDASRIAQCLGLDPTSYRNTHKQHDSTEIDQEDEVLGLESDEERFKNCDSFTFNCHQCGLVKVFDATLPAASVKCQSEGCEASVYEKISFVKNSLTRVLRGYINKYYENMHHCEEYACNNNTREIAYSKSHASPMCTVCKRGNKIIQNYDSTELYNQLCFLRITFSEGIFANEELLKIVDNTMLMNSYTMINVTRLFSHMFY